MSKFKAIKLPFHRLHLLDFWGSKADPKLHEANSLTAKVVLCKLWKQNLEPGEKVLPSIEADADQAMVRIREAIEQSDTSLLGALFEAAKETRELVENGLRQDLKRKIILAFSNSTMRKTPPRDPCGSSRSPLSLLKRSYAITSVQAGRKFPGVLTTTF
jgi:hypothetical protein